MPEPMTEAAFEAALLRAGLGGLSREEREGIRQATRFTVAMADRLRQPSPPVPQAEPAVVFAPVEAK